MKIGLSLCLAALVVTVSCSRYSGTPEEKMFQAIGNGDVKTVGRFLEKGYDPGMKREGQVSLVSSAFYSKNLEIFKLFINSGANPDKPDSSLPLSFLSAAALEKRIDWVNFLLENGADVNFLNNDRYKSTALMLAANENACDVMKVLIAHGADLNIRDRYGDAAVGFSTSKGHYEATEMLVNAGADLTIIGTDRINILDWAVRSGNKKLVTYLESLGLQKTIR
jgi:ankyrin repeat protein